MVNRIILAALILLASVAVAAAQCTGQPAGNTVCAAPNGAAGLPSFRPLVSGDLPAGGGAVTSVFTRTGAVVAAANDYSFAQLSGNQALGQMPAGAANTLFGNLALNTPAAIAVPACAAGSALGWTSGTGFICTAIAAAPVTSVFTRTGAVVAATNDYSFAQISGSLANSQLTAGHVVAGTGLTGGSLAGGGTVAADIATAAQFEAATANKLLAADKVFTAEVAVTYGTTTTFDFSTFINASVTLSGGNITTVTFSNIKAGQAGLIRFIQDGTGGRTIPTTINSNLKCAGGCSYTLSTSANAVDILPYTCLATSYCVGGGLLKDVK